MFLIVYLSIYEKWPISISKGGIIWDNPYKVYTLQVPESDNNNKGTGKYKCNSRICISIAPTYYLPWEFCVPVMENFILASMVWDAISTKHDY